MLPSDRYERAQVMEWLFFEQFDLMRNLAFPRFWIKIANQREQHAAEIAKMREAGERALRVMDQHLEGKRFFAADRYTVADVSLFGYTAVAHEGEYDMTRYPHITVWLNRVRQQTGYVPLIQE